MLTGRYDVWGYDPGVLRRYAEFMTFTQGGDPDHAGEYLRFLLPAPGGGAPKLRLHRLYAMLRLRYVFVPEKDVRWRGPTLCRGCTWPTTTG